MISTNKELTPGDIKLKPISLKEVNQNYLSWLNDKEVMKGLATSGYNIENLTEYVTDKIKDPNVSFMAIYFNQIHIGNIKLDFHDQNANVSELGLLIGDKNYWGRGVGFQACKLMVDYGFESLNLRKIYLSVYSNNPGAKRLYEKLGFKLEGTLRQHVVADDEVCDKFYMGIFKNERTWC